MPVVRIGCDLPELKRALAAAPETSVVLEDVRGGESKPTHFVCRVTGTDLRGFTEAIDHDPTVRSTTRLIALEECHLYRVEFADHRRSLRSMYEALVELDGIILAAVADDRGWTLRLFFPDPAGVSTFHEACRRSGLDPEVQSLSDRDRVFGARDYGLTEPQREVLLAAVRDGYFAIPKDVSLDDLANDLGVSDQALSERLRRGMDALVRNTIAGNT